MKNIVKVIMLTCIAIALFHTFSVLAENKTIEKNKINITKTMSSSQTSQYPSEKAKIEKSFSMSEGMLNSPFGLVGIVAIMALFVTSTSFPYVYSFSFVFGQAEKSNSLYGLMVENGTQIPPEMFLEGQKNMNPMDRDRRLGFLFTLSSIGSIIFLFCIKDTPPGSWSIGLIPLFLGLGYLISWKLADHKEKLGRESAAK